MSYYSDLSKLTLDALKSRFAGDDLLPSQQVLKADLDNRFEVLKNMGIKNALDLKTLLKTQKNADDFSAKTGLPGDFTTILRREINGLHPQARKLNEFAIINDRIVKNLENSGIKTTEALFGRVKTAGDRAKLGKETGADAEETLVLAKLADLSRIRYVNQAFATLLIHSAFDTVEKIKKADYNRVYEELMAVNAEKGLYKGKIGLNDMKILVRETRDLSLDIEY